MNVWLVPSVTDAIFTGRWNDCRKKIPRQRRLLWQSSRSGEGRRRLGVDAARIGRCVVRDRAVQIGRLAEKRVVEHAFVIGHRNQASVGPFRLVVCGRCLSDGSDGHCKIASCVCIKLGAGNAVLRRSDARCSAAAIVAALSRNRPSNAPPALN